MKKKHICFMTIDFVDGTTIMPRTEIPFNAFKTIEKAISTQCGNTPNMEMDDTTEFLCMQANGLTSIRRIWYEIDGVRTTLEEHEAKNNHFLDDEGNLV